MRILVTGGAGYIGSHTVKLLLATGHTVTVYDDLSTGHRASVPAECLVVGRLDDVALLDQILDRQRIEAVIHFAASALVAESVRIPAEYYANNVISTLLLLDLIRRHGIGRLVFSSTCATYGLPTRVPIDENEKQVPINPYGNTKLAIERAIADHVHAYGFGAAILRYFNAAGASQDGTIGEDHDPESHLIPIVCQAALKLRPAVQIYGVDYPTPDGTCIRDYTHVEDLATAHLLALERLTPGKLLVCNLGTGRGHSVREVIQAVEEVSGRRVPIQYGPARPGDPPELVACANRASELLGWKPAYTDIRDIIRTAWNWHNTHPAGYDD